MPHNISIESITKANFNVDKIEGFSAKSYFPDLPLRSEYEVPLSQAIEGSVAPDWSLSNSKNEIISLQDFKGKMVIIEFTGIGCGPCFAANPYLKQLASEKYVEVISIETWVNDLEVIRSYKEKHELDYLILKSDDEVKKRYGVKSVPQFFVLDQDLKIIEMIQGFQKGKTEQAIDEVIRQHH